MTLFIHCFFHGPSADLLTVGDAVEEGEEGEEEEEEEADGGMLEGEGEEVGIGEGQDPGHSNV